MLEDVASPLSELEKVVSPFDEIGEIVALIEKLESMLSVPDDREVVILDSDEVSREGESVLLLTIGLV